MSVNLEKTNLNFSGLFALGAISSLCVNTVVHPVATVKTRLMANLPNQRIFRPGLYNGFVAVCLVDLVSFPIIYGVQGSSEGKISALWASIIAGLASAPVVTIGEGAMTNRQLDKPYSFDVFKRSVRSAELVMTISREIPFTVGVFYAMPMLQEQIQKRFSILQQTPFTTIAVGAITGAAVGVATAPCDLIKTLVQTRNPPPSIIEAVQLVVKEDGWKGFFRGSKTRALYVGLTGVVMHVVNKTMPPYLTYFHAKNSE